MLPFVEKGVVQIFIKTFKILIKTIQKTVSGEQLWEGDFTVTCIF